MFHSFKNRTANPSSRWAICKSLHGKARLQYLFDYYKLPFVMICIALYVIIYVIYGQVTKKENVLYIAFANVTIGETLSGELLDGYLSDSGIDPVHNQIYTYQDLYLSSDPSDENAQYAYVSSTRLLAAIDSRQLDLVIMDQKALDIFIQKGYLADLSSLSSDLSSNLSPNLSTSSYAITLSNYAFFQEAGFTEDVFLGVIENTPRMDEVLDYLEYVHLLCL